MPLPPFIDVAGSRVTVPEITGDRARAWAKAIIDVVAYDQASSPEDLALLLQALIINERTQVLLKIEKAIVENIL